MGGPYNEFMCPIGHSVMNDPVIASDWKTYERKNIIKWMKIKKKSPLTNKFPEDVSKIIGKYGGKKT